MKTPVDVWIVDPANLTPYYSLALCGGLASAGAKVRFVASKFHYDDAIVPPAKVAIDYDYLGPLQALQTKCGSSIRKLTRAALYPFGHRNLVARAKRERPGIVHLQWSRMPKADLWAIHRLRSLGVKVVHTVHDVEPLYRGAGGRSALGRVYSNCDATIVHTHANARDLVKRYPEVDASRVHVLPHGPLQSETAPANADQTAARKVLGIAPDVPVALFFGTIKRYKGLDVLLAALPAAAARVDRICLLVAGKPGGPADVPSFDAATKAGVDVRTEFGFIANADVWKYYLAADLVVLPYRNITQSGVLLSGLAFGRAALVTRVGGLPEIVEAGQIGWVVEPENPSALAEALVTALADRRRLATMGSRAAEFVQSEYSWERIGANTLKLYESLMQNVR